MYTSSFHWKVKCCGESHFWVICTSGFIFQESGDCFLFSKTPLGMINIANCMQVVITARSFLLATAGPFVQSS